MPAARAAARIAYAAGLPDLSQWLLGQVAETRQSLHQLAVSIALHRVAEQAGAFNKSMAGQRFPRPVQLSALTDLNKGLGEAVGKLWKRLHASFPSLSDISVKDGTVSISTADALVYVAGGWFEEAIYGELERALPEAEIAMNLVTTLDRAVREIDVVIACRDQLHAIECKTGAYARKASKKDGIDGSTVDRLIALRRLIGPRGTVALAASRHADDATNSYTVEDLRQTCEPGFDCILDRPRVPRRASQACRALACGAGVVASQHATASGSALAARSRRNRERRSRNVASPQPRAERWH